jgi:glycosyltransferase involved in cell wall biosynthesis
MFSIIFAVNKDNPYLDLAIESMLSQSFDQFEFLISANNCDDYLFLKLSQYAIKDKRIRLFRSNIGQLAYNLNLLADNAKYDYLVRMDSDDVSITNRLSIVKDFIEKTNHNFDLIGSWVDCIDTNNNFLKTAKTPVDQNDIYKNIAFGSPFVHPSVVMKKQWLFSLRGYLGGFVSEDYDLWLRGVRNKSKMTNIPISLLNYRIHANQVSRSPLGYAETFSHLIREFVLKPRLNLFFGLVIAGAKIILNPLINFYYKLKILK